MRVFLYEFVTGGGWLSSGAKPEASLLREGGAMVSALTTDLCRIDGLQLDVMRGHGMAESLLSGSTVHTVSTAAEEWRTFQQLSEQADWTILIVPELDNLLVRRAEVVVAVGGRLLGSSLEAMRVASNKQQLCEWLDRDGIPVPCGQTLVAGQAIPDSLHFPVVLKRIDGAGSMDMSLISSEAATMELAPKIHWRVEAFCPGVPCSIAFLCGGDHYVDLLPGRQLIDSMNGFAYSGSVWPLPPALERRARDLGTRALRSLPRLAGYVGVDLILGAAADGREDVVVEVNPRLTTSYVGLRALTKDNLAQVMVDVVQERTVAIEFDRKAMHLMADGQLRTGLSKTPESG